MCDGMILSTNKSTQKCLNYFVNIFIFWNFGAIFKNLRHGNFHAHPLGWKWAFWMCESKLSDAKKICFSWWNDEFRLDIFFWKSYYCRWYRNETNYNLISSVIFFIHNLCILKISRQRLFSHHFLFRFNVQ